MSPFASPYIFSLVLDGVAAELREVVTKHDSTPTGIIGMHDLHKILLFLNLLDGANITQLLSASVSGPPDVLTALLSAAARLPLEIVEIIPSFLALLTKTLAAQTT